MSESESGSGRKGFVRDVMRRISSTPPREGDGEPDSERPEPRSYRDEVEASPLDDLPAKAGTSRRSGSSRAPTSAFGPSGNGCAWPVIGYGCGLGDPVRSTLARG